MLYIGAYEARTRLSELLERVQRREKVTITRYGRSIAVLAPSRPVAGADVREIISEIRRFRAGHKLYGLTLRETVEEGRK